MADMSTTPATPTSPRGTQQPHGRANSSPHHGRGRGGQGGQGRRPRGPRGGGAIGRGQSNQSAEGGHQVPDRSHPSRPPGLPPGGTFGGRLTEDASATQGETKGKAAQDEAVDEREVCFICASNIDHTSIAPCNHQTCHICALRLRALYKTRACAHCRTEASFVVLTDDASKRFQDFSDEQFVKIDDNLGIKYENNEVLEDTILLLRYNCPDADCEVACLGWPDLHRHVKTKHGKVMCDLCTRNKKVFTHEHELFSYGELRRHERFGDDNPGAIDQSGFRGHPECGFCRERFYGDDELYTHCREKHERCHICDRRNSGQHPQYYLNYQELEKHFAQAHFVCLDPECQANKTNVFESEIDLKAHQLSAHPNGLSKDARRDVRLVSLSGFDLREPYQPQRRGGRDHRGGGGRGRDPNAEPLPMSSAQPIGRAELAYQRQMAIQSAQSVSTRQFGGQLTQSAPQSPRPSRPQPAQATLDPPSLEALDLHTGSDSTTQTPHDRARALRHAAVISRAQTLLHNDATKLASFRSHVSSYRTSSINATDLIDAIFSLFDAPASELGKLIRELADLYENEEKRQSLLTAWNDWKSINEDYPSLPGPQGTLPGSSTSTLTGASTGRRVLRLKSSTAQSSRSAVSRQGSWGNALSQSAPSSTSTATSSRLNNPFPALPPSSSNAALPFRKQASPTPWSTSTTSTAPRSNTPTISNHTNTLPRKTTAVGGTAASEMFPSLPPAPVPSTLMAGTTRGSVRWDQNLRNQASEGNVWGAASNSTMPNGNGGEGEADGETTATGKKKGRGKKKGEVLYHFG